MKIKANVFCHWLSGFTAFSNVKCHFLDYTCAPSYFLQSLIILVSSGVSGASGVFGVLYTRLNFHDLEALVEILRIQNMQKPQILRRFVSEIKIRHQ